MVASESMVMYVEHVKRLHARESTDHQATRLRLMKAQQEWSDVGDNSVNVNITRRSSTVGGSTQVQLQQHTLEQRLYKWLAMKTPLLKPNLPLLLLSSPPPPPALSACLAHH